MVIHLKRKLVSILTKCSKQIEIQLRNIDRQFDNSFVICLPQLIRQFSKIFVFLSNLLKVFATKISSRNLPAFVSQRVTNVSTTTLGRVHGLVNILFQYQTCRCQSKSISQGSEHLVLKLKQFYFPRWHMMLQNPQNLHSPKVFCRNFSNVHHPQVLSTKRKDLIPQR